MKTMEKLLLTKDQLREQIKIQEGSIDKEGITIKYNYDDKTLLLIPSGQEGAATLLKKSKLVSDFIIENKKVFILVKEDIYELDEHGEMSNNPIIIKVLWNEYVESIKYKLSQYAALEMAACHEYDNILKNIIKQSISDQIKYKKHIA
jgi:hypothetical protein